MIWFVLLTAACAGLAAQPLIQYPPEPLDKRLNRIADDFGIRISYDQLRVKNNYAPGTDLQTANPENILKISLEKTGLGFKKHDSKHYYIVPLRKGNIEGLIIDVEDGLPLAGVSIEMDKNIFISSAKGSFNILAEEGTYDVTISAVGYASKQIPLIEVQAGKVRHLDLTMEKKHLSLPEVKVISPVAAENIRAHYARQKQAGVIADGLVAQQVETIPDKPLTQVIKRINGVNLIGSTIGVRGLSERYSQVLMDGIALPSLGLNKRELALDVFPKELVREIILVKTSAADMPPEFSGGQIHIRSLSIPGRSFTSFHFEAGGNSRSAFKEFHWLGKKGGLDWLGIDNGTRKKPSNIQSWQWYNNVPLPPPNDPTGNYTLIPGEQAPYNSLNATAQSKTIPATGLVPATGGWLPDVHLNFSLGRAYALKRKATLGFVSGTSVYRRQSLAYFNNRRRSSVNLFLPDSGSGTQGTGNQYQFVSGTGSVFNLGLKTPTFKITFQNMLSTQLKDNFYIASRIYPNKGQYRRFQELFQEPQQYVLQQHKLEAQKTFANNAVINYFVSFTGARQKLMDRRYFQYFISSETGASEVYNTPNILYNWRQNNDSNVVDNRTWVDGTEKVYTSGLSVSGSLIRSKNILVNLQSGWVVTLRTKVYTALRLLPYTNSRTVVTGRYEQLLDPEADSPVYYWAENTNGNINSGKMTGQAFYLLTDQRLWSRLHLYYGFRAEYYYIQNDQQTFLRRLHNGAIPPQYGNGITGEKGWLGLPSVNLVYHAGKKMNLRAAFSKTVLRPDFRELSYFGLFEYELDGNIGGRQLTTTKVDNYDIRWEWYPSPEENISFSVFHKNLKNPVELAQAATSWRAYGYINQYAARTSGIELEMRKSLQFLAPQSFMKNLTVQGNYTRNWSEVEVMSYPLLTNGVFTQRRMPGQDRPLVNQAPWTVNAGLLYNGPNMGLFVFYNRSGPATYVTHDNPNLIEYEKGADQLDLSFYIKCLKNKGRFTFNVLNILDQWRIYYTNNTAYKQINGNWQLVNGSVAYNPKDGDAISYRIKQGINAGIGFTFRL